MLSMMSMKGVSEGTFPFPLNLTFLLLLPSWFHSGRVV